MKTPVLPDPQQDREELERSFAEPRRFEQRKTFPNSDFEMLKPNRMDVAGFVLTFAATFAIVGLAAWVAGIGG